MALHLPLIQIVTVIHCNINNDVIDDLYDFSILYTLCLLVLL